MVDGADRRGVGHFHIGYHMFQIQQKIIAQAGISPGTDNILMFAANDRVRGFLKSLDGVVNKNGFQIFGGVFQVRFRYSALSFNLALLAIRCEGTVMLLEILNTLS